MELRSWGWAVLGGLGLFSLSLAQAPDSLAQSRVINERVSPDVGRAGAQTTRRKQESSARGACLIQPTSITELSASAAGVLSKVLVERGQRVKQGQVLAVLDHNVESAMVAAARARAKARASVSAAQATRAMAQQKLIRMRALKQLSYGAQLELELADGEFKVAGHRLQQAKDNANIAQREYAVAQQQLAQREIRSPINGVVADRLLEPGERVDGRAVFRLMNIDRLQVELVLPSERFGEIERGMAIEIEPSVGNTGAVQAKVVQVDPFIDAASATFRARLDLANASGKVPAGARCRLVADSAGTSKGSTATSGG